MKVCCSTSFLQYRSLRGKTRCSAIHSETVRYLDYHTRLMVTSQSPQSLVNINRREAAGECWVLLLQAYKQCCSSPLSPHNSRHLKAKPQPQLTNMTTLQPSYLHATRPVDPEVEAELPEHSLWCKKILSETHGQWYLPDSTAETFLRSCCSFIRRKERPFTA